MSRLSECTCADLEAPLISYFHERGRERMKLWGHKTTGSVLIGVLFEQLASHVFEASAVRVAKGQGRCWPACIADIIPFGHPALVTAVGQWIIVLDEPSMPLQFLTAALPICGRPLFVAVSTSPVFLKQVRLSMKATCRRLEDGSQWLDQYPLLRFGALLHAIMSCRTSQNSIMIWTRGHEIELWKVFSNAVRIMQSRKPAREEDAVVIRQIIQSFRDLILQFPPEATEPAWIHPALIIKPGYTITSWPSYTKAGLLDIVIFLADLKQQRYCFVLGCPRSFQEIGNTFQKCSACNVLGYCSSACQAADWKVRHSPFSTNFNIQTPC
jgi:hypothetical protein